MPKIHQIKSKSCRYCFNLVNAGICIIKCKLQKWERIIVNNTINKALSSEFREKAVMCNNFDCEAGERYIKMRCKYGKI